jgi:predicted small lipoprotein YifL
MDCRHNVAAAIRSAMLRTEKALPERALSPVLPRIRLVLAVAGMAALGLSGCGRAGPLELPPGPATPAPSAQLTMPDGSAAPGSAQDTALRTGFDTQGNPVSPPGQKRSFVLDRLLQ